MLDTLCNQESGAVFALCSLRYPDAGVGQKGAFFKGLVERGVYKPVFKTPHLWKGSGRTSQRYLSR